VVSRFYYVSHPEVAVDPNVAVPEWGLSDLGLERAIAMLEQPWLAQIASVGTRPEPNAVQTARILGHHLDTELEVIDDSHEIDRSATGFVTHDRHEALADRLFADPTVSADGWERAIDAQRRIVERCTPLLQTAAPSQVVVGHGGVGTLLLCHLLGIEIDRLHDQPGQGYYWAYAREHQQVLHRWRPIDRIEPTITIESPETTDVVRLLKAHLDFTGETSPAEHVHALDLTGLLRPDITFCTARRSGELLGVGALRDLGDRRAEIKSMHTAVAARGQGVGRFMLEHLVDLARSRSATWIGLETGTMDEFAAARALYASYGFTRCKPFGNYTDNEFSLCMDFDL